jgi:hypothetical protein
MILRGFHDNAGRKVEEMKNELIGMLRFDAERTERFRWKVADIHCDNDISTSADRRGQGMVIIEIG